MAHIFNVSVRNKVPRRNDDEQLVCDNRDYQIKFEFDSEWSEYPIKTVRFAYKDKFQDIVFEGDTVDIPVMRDVTVFFVGVFAGDIHTTAPVAFRCKKSILGEQGTPDDPSPDVYAQLFEMLRNFQTELKGDPGKDGIDGKDGADGADGKDGHTPVKGTDYWTDADKAEIKAYVDDAILGGAW